MASGYWTEKTARVRTAKVPEAPQLNSLYIAKRQVMGRSENCCEVCRRNTCFEAKRSCFATIHSKTMYSQKGQSTLLTLRAAGSAFYRPPALCNALPRHFLCFSRHWHIFCSKFKSSFSCKFQNCFINAFFVMYRFKFIVKITSPVQACCLLFQAMPTACHGLIIDAYKLLVYADRFFLTYGAVMQA